MLLFGQREFSLRFERSKSKTLLFVCTANLNEPLSCRWTMMNPNLSPCLHIHHFHFRSVLLLALQVSGLWCKPNIYKVPLLRCVLCPIGLRSGGEGAFLNLRAQFVAWIYFMLVDDVPLAYLRGHVQFLIENTFMFLFYHVNFVSCTWELFPPRDLYCKSTLGATTTTTVAELNVWWQDDWIFNSKLIKIWIMLRDLPSKISWCADGHAEYFPIDN